MERLTYRIINDKAYLLNGTDAKWRKTEAYDVIDKAIQKLAKYEDLEEKGLLSELPCKIGQEVYTNTSMQGWYMRKNNRPYKAKIVFIGINEVDNFMNVMFENGNMLQFPFSQIGKTVFLTEEEAKQAKEKTNEKYSTK